MNRKASAKAPRSRGSAASTASTGERPFLHLVGDQMGDHLGVGLRAELRALALQLLAQLAEILDDAVVHDREALGGVRMGIALGRLAVGGPAGVTDADVARERLARQHGLEIAQLAGRTPARELSPLEGGDAGGIVTAIFQPLQRIDEQAGHRLASENAHDSAHARAGLLSRRDSTPDVVYRR